MNTERLGKAVGQTVRDAFYASVATGAVILLWSFIDWTLPLQENLNGSLVRLVWAISFMIAVGVTVFAGTEGEE